MSLYHCPRCGKEIVHVRLTLDELEEMDPEEIEAWQDANTFTCECEEESN